MKSAEEYFNENYGKNHLDRCIELNDKQSIYALMEEFADSVVKNLTIPDVSVSLCNHHFTQADQFWQKCNHCGMIKPLGQ